MVSILLVNNPSSIGSLLVEELSRRGIRAACICYPQPYSRQKGTTWLATYNGNSLVRRGWVEAKLRLNKYDIALVLGPKPKIRINADKIVKCHNGVETTEYQEHSFYVSPNLAQYGDVLLPRPVDVERFSAPHIDFWKEKVEAGPKKMIIGHYWRRGSFDQDYSTKYHKDTDLLLSAIEILKSRDWKVSLHEEFVPATLMTNAYAKIHVLAEQYRYGSYGIPCVEALLAGCPVSGYYEKGLCECGEVYNLASVSQRSVVDIADSLVRARETKIESSNPVIKKFHSPEHSTDVLLETLSDWGLLTGS